MLVERKNVKLNGTDFSSYFADVGYEVRYVRVQGNNGGMMQDGTTLLDTLKYKPVVVLPTFCLNETQISNLLSVLVTDYIALYYFDPYTGGYRTISAIPSEQRVKYRGNGADASSYWTGNTIELTEQ